MGRSIEPALDELLYECWFCYWGWPEPIYDIYARALEALAGDTAPLLCGPAHVVWADENFDSAQWCIDNFEHNADDLTPREREVVLRSLHELLQVQDSLKDCPEEYDGEHPELYPPPPGIKMINWNRFYQEPVS